MAMGDAEELVKRTKTPEEKREEREEGEEGEESLQRVSLCRPGMIGMFTPLQSRTFDTLLLYQHIRLS